LSSKPNFIKFDSKLALNVFYNRLQKTPGYQLEDESELIKTSAEGSNLPVSAGVFVSLIKLILRKLRPLRPEKFIMVTCQSISPNTP